MKVVLLDNIRGIGRVGDIKNVSDGYARNFLLKRGLAKAATIGAMKDAESVKAKKLAASELARSETETLAHRLRDITIEIPAKANAQGKLFAGIEARHIADAISTAAHVRIDPQHIDVPGHLKTIGDHPVTIRLTEGITATVLIRIQKAP
jgi:large subunit ribosomal protein L9